MAAKVPWSETSWNIRSRGAKVPGVRKFHGMKVLRLFAPRERMFHGSESSLCGFSLPGTKVQRNKKARYRQLVSSFLKSLCIEITLFLTELFQK